MLVDDVDENGLGRLLRVGVRAASAASGWVGGRKQYLGALVIILLALNARGNLLRFTSVVENNSFPLSISLVRFGSLGCGMLLLLLAASDAFCPKRQKMPDTI